MISSHSCCRFVGCTSMMWISRSTTSQRCSIGLRSGDCGVKWTRCHVQETSLRWFDLCVMLHYPAGSIIRRWVHCSHKGMDMVSNNTQVGCGVLTMLNWYKSCHENIPHTITPPPAPWTVETRQDDPCFHVLYAKFWSYRLNVAAEIETHIYIYIYIYIYNGYILCIDGWMDGCILWLFLDWRSNMIY